MTNLNIYSEEPLSDIWTGYTILHNNGNFMKSITANRRCTSSKIFINIGVSGSVNIKVYKGYKADRDTLTFDLANSVIISGTDYNDLNRIIIDDMLGTKQEYICYYIGVIALEDYVELKLNKYGVYFDDFLSVSDFQVSNNTNIQNDINMSPLKKQKYDKYVNFNLYANRAQLQQIINVIEFPYYLVHNENSVNNDTLKLSNISITPSYINDTNQWMSINLKNIEEI